MRAWWEFGAAGNGLCDAVGVGLLIRLLLTDEEGWDLFLVEAGRSKTFRTIPSIGNCFPMVDILGPEIPRAVDDANRSVF